MHIITNAASIHVCYRGLISLPALSGINSRNRYDRRGMVGIVINKYCSVQLVDNLGSTGNCQNPNSTNNSIELNLRLDYILTERSTTQTLCCCCC